MMSLPSTVLAEINIATPIKRGDQNADVKKVQEWLCYHGYRTVVDEDFGAATERCVLLFQESLGIPKTGVVDNTTYSQLVAPLNKALESISPLPGENLADITARHARQHLSVHPIEIGGENRGPWVRTYMDGNEGPDYPWCAGFVTFVIRQACANMNCEPPISRTFDCWDLARQAADNGRFVKGEQVNIQSWSTHKLEPCSIFLIRDGSGHWQHTGFSLGDNFSETCSTIEGNTNDDGNAEGYEVCSRTRSTRNMDFISIA
jgi:Putative peptidoglycan binding domain